METILLAIITGLIAVDIYFKYAVDAEGNSSNFSELYAIFLLVLAVSGLFYGIAFLFKKIMF